MPFLRFTRDRRGYENTFLLDAAQPGDRPRVLYWYRSAPGVQVGRPALDEDAIRTIEEQHPDIEFDWPHILEVGAMSPPEVERRPIRQRRKPPKPQEEEPAVAEGPVETAPEIDEEEESSDEESSEEEQELAAAAAKPHGMLEQLVGREIATRLRGRYAEIVARIHQHAADEATREVWEARASALDPDSWVTPDEILRGVENADRLFDELRKVVTSTPPHRRSE